ncbi:alpha-L-rhamnosidase C-terminal domain-containing protein [Micromonosporaceae bacterium B7E4]
MTTNRPRARRAVAAVAVVTLVAGMLAHSAVVQAHTNGCVDPEPGVETLSCQPIAPEAGWRAEVQAVPGRYARPKSVSVDGPADVVSNPEGLLAESGGVATLNRTGEGTTRLVVDFGVLVSGYVELGVRQASGAPIRMAYAEGRDYLGHDGDADPDPDGFFYKGRTLGTDDDPDGRADVFDPPAAATVLTSPGLRGSQRYVAITLDGPGTVAIDFVRVRQTNYASRYDGHFLSSDPLLNHAWYASAYAIDLSTVKDTRRNPDASWVIADGPKRDRVVYAGDLRVVAQSAYYQSAGYRQVVRDSLNLFACQQRPDGTFPAASLIDVPCRLGDPGPPDGSPAGFEPPGEAQLARIDSFTAWWVTALADYLRYTGDTQFVRPLLPVARRAVQFFLDHSPDGVLFRTDNYDGLLAFHWHTPDQAVGVDAYSNEAFYGALHALAQLERAAGDDTAAGGLEARAEQVRVALLDTLWDPAVGAMRLNTEDPRRDHSADANAGALLFGLLDQDQAASAMTFLAGPLRTDYGTATSQFTDNPYMTRYISPYILAQEALGRFRYSDAAGALRLIRTAWTHMRDAGPGTPWEEVGVDGTPVVARPGTSLAWGGHVGLAHAWSTAIPALSMHLLGVQPKDDGYQRWTIRPQPGDVDWVQGDVPVPGGELSARWRRGADDRSFVLTVEAPRSTQGSIAIPLLGQERTIAMDGRIIWQDGQPAPGVHASRTGDTVLFTHLSGNHTFAWTEPSTHS